MSLFLFPADPNRYERDGEKPDIKGGLTIVDQGSDKVQNVVDEGEDRAQNRVAPLEEVKVIYPEDNKVKVNGGDVSEEELESNKVLPRREQPDRPKQSSVTTRRPKPIKQVRYTGILRLGIRLVTKSFTKKFLLSSKHF